MERDNEVFIKQTPPVSPTRNSPMFSSNNNGTTPCSLIDSGVFGSELDKASNRSISDSDSIHSSIYNYNQNSPTHGTTWREIDSKKTSKRDPLTTSLYQNFLNIPELSSPTVKTIIPMEDDTSSETSSAQICGEEELEEDVQNLLNDGNETLIMNPTMETSYHWDEYIPSNNWNTEVAFEINDIMNISIHNDFDLFNYSTNLNDSLPFIGEEQIDSHNMLSEDKKGSEENEGVCNIFKLILSPITNYLLSNNNINDDILLFSTTSKSRHNKGNKKKGYEENSLNKLYQFVKEYFSSDKIKILTGVRKEDPEIREKIFEKMVMKLHQYQRRLGQNLHEDEDLWKGKKEISKLHELGELIQFKILINSIVINENLMIEKNVFKEEKLFDIAEDWFTRIFIQNPIETFLNINLCKVIMKDIVNKQNKKHNKCNNEKLKLQFMLLQQIYDLHYTNIPSMVNSNKIEGIHLLPPIEDLEILRKFLNSNFKTFSLPAYYPPLGGRWRRSLSRTKEFWLMITKNACISLFLGISFLFITTFFNNWVYQTCCQEGSSSGWIFGLTLKKTGNGVPPM
uniref:NR LBD domain-containing protein n=1 Tax=Strongyloides papillosus TaxID=174720 RepID=A0A0N5C0N9_STREA